MFSKPSRLLAVACLLALCGCAGLQRRSPPTLEQVVQMSQSGVPAETIIRELNETRAVYPLTGSQIAKLHDEGVPDPVLDYLQKVYIEHERLEERAWIEDRHRFGACVGCYYYHPWVAPYFIYPY